MFFRSTKKADGGGPVPPAPSVPRASVATSSNPNIKSTGKQSVALFTGSSLVLNTPALKSVPPAERPALFLHHLRVCETSYNFNNASVQIEEKEAKRLLLLGLVEHINSAKDVFTEASFPAVISFLSANLFRDLPFNPHDDAEDDEPVLEPAWPHLQIVYEFLLRFVVSADVDAKVAKKYISQSFIAQLLELFHSDDPREREYLKTILHRIYGKYMGLRAFIRRSINHVFYHLMYCLGAKHGGVGELLEILGSIINGFALPLKAEHKRFLVRALIPLHKVQGVAMFHNQLSYCVSQFVEKDPKMIEVVMLGVLRYWPHSSSPKQVLFLNELEDLLELTQPGEFARLAAPLFEVVNRCISSPHFQVSERALFLFNNEYVVSLVQQNLPVVLPLIMSSLQATHWNNTVMTLTSNVAKLLQEMDSKYYRECHMATLAKDKEFAAKRLQRIEKWDSLEREVNADGVI